MLPRRSRRWARLVLTMRKALPPEPNLPNARIEPRGAKGHWQRASAWVRYVVTTAVVVAVALGFLVGVVAFKRALRGPTASDRYAAQARERERELAPYRQRCPDAPETCRQLDLDKQRGEAQVAALEADPAFIRSQAYLHARDYPHEGTASLAPAAARYSALREAHGHPAPRRTAPAAPLVPRQLPAPRRNDRNDPDDRRRTARGGGRSAPRPGGRRARRDRRRAERSSGRHGPCDDPVRPARRRRAATAAARRDQRDRPTVTLGRQASNRGSAPAT
jgi:hypothetical protein